MCGEQGPDHIRSGRAGLRPIYHGRFFAAPRERGFNYEWYDAVYEDFQRIAEFLGINFRTRSVHLMGGGARQELRIFFSGFWSQGDGAC